MKTEVLIFIAHLLQLRLISFFIFSYSALFIAHLLQLRLISFFIFSYSALFIAHLLQLRLISFFIFSYSAHFIAHLLQLRLISFFIFFYSATTHLLLCRLFSSWTFSCVAYFHSTYSPTALKEIRRRGKKMPFWKNPVGQKKLIEKKINWTCILYNGLTGTYYIVIICLALMKKCVLHRGRRHITTAWRIAPNEINLSLPQLTIGQMQKTSRSLLSKQKETD